MRLCAITTVLAVLAPAATAKASASFTAPGLCWPADRVAAFQLSETDAFALPPEAIVWDFGDGAGALGPNAEHLYGSAGLRRVRATVTRTVGSNAGTTTSESLIFVSAPHTGSRQTCDIFRLSEIRSTPPRGGRPVQVSGRVILPDGTGAPGRLVGLRSPDGPVVARATSGADGSFAFNEPMGAVGSWRLLLLDIEAGNGQPVSLERRPRLRVSPPTGAVGPDADLVVRGGLVPALGGKLVQLEFRAEGSWRPLAQARTRAGGRFALRYRFRRSGARYAVPMRVAAPRDRGWPYATIRSRRFTIQVGG